MKTLQIMWQQHSEVLKELEMGAEDKEHGEGHFRYCV